MTSCFGEQLGSATWQNLSSSRHRNRTAADDASSRGFDAGSFPLGGDTPAAVTSSRRRGTAGRTVTSLIVGSTS